MKRKTKEPKFNPIDEIRKLTPKQILAACDLIKGDGHMIWKPSAFSRIWPNSAVISVMRRHESDTNSPMSTIFGHDGEILDSCAGVYGLSVLAYICVAFEIESEGKLGRGWQARAYDKAIREHFSVEKK